MITDDPAPSTEVAPKKGFFSSIFEPSSDPKQTHSGKIRKSEILDTGERVGPGGYKPSAERLEVEELWGHHHEVARLAICGFSDTAIAEELGITSATVGRIRQLPAVREKLRSLTERKDQTVLPMAQRIKGLSDLALQRIRETLEIDAAQDDVRMLALQVNTAQDILDRNGYGAVKRTIAVNTHEMITDQRQSILLEIRERAKAINITKDTPGSPDQASRPEEPIIDIAP